MGKNFLNNFFIRRYFQQAIYETEGITTKRDHVISFTWFQPISIQADEQLIWKNLVCTILDFLIFNRYKKKDNLLLFVCIVKYNTFALDQNEKGCQKTNFQGLIYIVLPKVSCLFPRSRPISEIKCSSPSWLKLQPIVCFEYPLRVIVLVCEVNHSITLLLIPNANKTELFVIK